MNTLADYFDQITEGKLNGAEWKEGKGIWRATEGYSLAKPSSAWAPTWSIEDPYTYILPHSLYPVLFYFLYFFCIPYIT